MIPKLPRLAWVFLLTRISPAFGNGLALPFVIIYLHNARGISLQAAGLIWGARILIMIGGSFVAGPLIDRYGPVLVSLVGLATTAAGWVILAFATDVRMAVLSSLVAGIGGGVAMPTNGSLVSRFITPQIRHTVFSLQFGIFNLGIAFGAAVAGFIASSSHPSSYTLLFILTALMSLPTAAFNVYLGLKTEPVTKPRQAGEAPRGGYRTLLANPLIVRLLLASLAYFLAGEAIWSVGIAPYMKNVAGFPEEKIGLVFAANTVAVFFFQFVVSRLAEGRERLRVLAAGHLVWAFAFVLVVVATRALSGTPLLLSLIGIAVVIAAAECTAPPVVQPLLLATAPAHLHGRTMALISKGQSVGMASGTAIVGLLLAGHSDLLWISAGCVLAATGVLLLSTFVTEENRFVPCSE